MTGLRLLGTALVLALTLSACSEPEPAPIYIKGFGGKSMDLLVGDKRDQQIEISRAPDTKIYVVVVKGTWESMVEVSYESQKNDGIIIRFDPGQTAKSVYVEGLAEGKGTIRFQIRDTKEYQDLKFSVAKYIPPDAGPTPDYGPLPDVGLVDKGAAKEASTADQGAKEAAVTDQAAAKEVSVAADLAAQ